MSKELNVCVLPETGYINVLSSLVNIIHYLGPVPVTFNVVK